MEKLREFLTQDNTKILAGKSAESNEMLIKQVQPDELVFHTAEPGSPFVNIKSEKPSKSDIKEATTICARYSQAWRDTKSNVAVHVFYGRDVYKTKDMKTGTFGVKKYKVIKAEKKDIELLIQKQGN